jgi:hypothetical protein
MRQPECIDNRRAVDPNPDNLGQVITGSEQDMFRAIAAEGR